MCGNSVWWYSAWCMGAQQMLGKDTIVVLFHLVQKPNKPHLYPYGHKDISNFLTSKAP